MKVERGVLLPPSPWRGVERLLLLSKLLLLLFRAGVGSSTCTDEERDSVSMTTGAACGGVAVSTEPADAAVEIFLRAAADAT